jgi:hypothetical protein
LASTPEVVEVVRSASFLFEARQETTAMLRIRRQARHSQWEPWPQTRRPNRPPDLPVLSRRRRGCVATDSTSKMLAGVDQTAGDSGACGINKALVSSLPFPLDQVS